jgi:hypothetical protein
VQRKGTERYARANPDGRTARRGAGLESTGRDAVMGDRGRCPVARRKFGGELDRPRSYIESMDEGHPPSSAQSSPAVAARGVGSAGHCPSRRAYFNSVAVRIWPPDRQLEGRSSK